MIRSFITSLVALSLFGGAASAQLKTPPITPKDARQYGEAGRNLSKDLTDLGKDLGAMAGDKRDDLTKGLCARANLTFGDKFNVMICNLSEDHDPSGLKGMVYYDSFGYHRNTFIGGQFRFGVWVFREGTFVLRGDGGFINWCFHGNFERGGNQNKTVTFKKR